MHTITSKLIAALLLGLIMLPAAAAIITGAPPVEQTVTDERPLIDD